MDENAKKRILHERMKRHCPDMLNDLAPFGKLAAIHGELSDGTKFAIGTLLPGKDAWDGKARPTYKQSYTGRSPLFSLLTEGDGLIGVNIT